MKFIFHFFLKIIVYAIYITPYRLRYILAYFVSILWFDILRLRRRVLLENLSIAFPGKDIKEHKAIIRRSLVESCLSLFEYSDIYFYNPSKINQYFEIKNVALFEKALLSKKGVLILGLHMSSGDFGIAALSQMKLPMYLISKRFTLKWLDELWFNLREKHGTQFIAPRKSSYEILKALKKNAAVIFVLDQFMGPPLGLKTDFFGKETGSAMGLALFALKTRAPVLSTYTYRKSCGKLVVTFKEEVDFEQKQSKDETLQFMTQKYTDKIEEIIREHPEQWMWLHRRWKEFKY